MLYIVATPIGNKDDITLRARAILEEAACILAEDTRKTGMFLKRLGISKKRMVSFYEYNEERRLEQILDQLRQDQTIALVSTAGTPTISDPGYKLIRACRRQGIAVTALPGPCAAVNALALSGLPTDSFFFTGFLPRKSGRRRKELARLKDMPTTIICYESPFRTGALIKDIEEVLGDRNIAVIREMTKLHEEVIAGPVQEVRRLLDQKKLKGEVTVVIDNRPRQKNQKA